MRQSFRDDGCLAQAGAVDADDDCTPTSSQVHYETDNIRIDDQIE